MKRVRLWPHTPDIYASLVYFPVSSRSDLSSLSSRVCLAASAAWKCPVSCIDPCSLHVSVSRTLPLPGSLRARLSQRVASLISSSLSLCSFAVRATHLVVLPNEAGATSFLALAIEGPELEETTRALDRELRNMGLPEFPDPPVYHVSLAWVDGDWTSSSTNSNEFLNQFQDEVQDMTFKLQECVLKIGDVLHTFSLPVE